MRNFDYISRPTAYETAKVLADRDDHMRPFTPLEVPEMKYPVSHLRRASLWAFIKSFAA